MQAMFRFATVAVIALLWHVAPSAAQTTYTWSGATDGSWATSSNWDTLPAPGTGTRIVLAGSSNTATVVDFATLPFELNRLQQNSTAANGFQVGGGALRFVGSGAVVQSSSTGGPLRVNSAIDFAADTTVNSAANFNSGSEIILAGRLSSAAGTTISFAGGVGAGQVLTGMNNTGLNGTFALASGTQTIVVLGGHNTVSRTTVVDLTGGSSTSGFRTATSTATGPGFADAGFHQQLGGLAGTADVDNAITAGTFQIGSAAAASTVVIGYNNANSTLTSNTTSGASLITGSANGHFGKVGTGTFTYGGSGAFGQGSVSVRDGAIVLESPNGSNGAFQNGANPQGDIFVYAGATLRLNNGTGSANNQNRIGNTAAVVLAGGTLRMDGATEASSEQIGALRLASGQSVVELNANNRGTRFSLVNGITNAPTAALVFRGAAFGEVSSTSTTTAANGFSFDTLANATALLSGNVTTGTYGDTAKDLGIIRFASSGTGATIDSFVTFDVNTNSVRRLADSNYASTLGADTDNVSLSTAATVSSATTANSLRLTAGGSVNNSSTLTLTAGALLNNGGGNVAGTGTLAFGAGGSRTAYVTTNGGSTIGNAISAANLSKNGAGNLTLTNTTTLTGTAGNTVAVNAGTLTLANTAAVTTSTELSGTNTLTYQVSRGATLDVSGFGGGYSIGQFQTLTGGGTSANPASTSAARVVGNVVVNSGGTVAPSALGGSQASLLSPGTLVVDGNLSLNGGSTYVWAVNSAITDGDNTVAPTADTLGNYKSAYTSSLLSTTGTLDLTGASANNRITLKLTSLSLSNDGGAVYDLFDGNSRSWVLMEAAGISEFSEDKFTLDVSALENVDASRLSVHRVGNSVVLTFSPVPEPAGMLALAAGVGAVVAGWRRARRRTPGVSPTSAA
jgi:hypothetical protein